MADDGDDYTKIFGVGSDLGPTSLWIGFFSVAAYLLLFSGLLDKLETLTVGTSYHLMLQRIYREIMMVGLGSFAFTILNQTSSELPFGLSQAFGFADICCFSMSSFFCLQGVFIMVASVKQAQNWNVASQIPAEELLHNMSVWELSHRLAWNARYLPFCPTREQVEFRVLKSIFATAYNIKASHSEFDFSIFLRMTHEKNIVKIIDISFKNWCYILVLTAFASLKLRFWETKCTTESCEIEEDVQFFTFCGAVYGILSVVLWIWGRLLELRLIASAGVEHVDDYSIFLMTEFRTLETLADVATSPLLAKDVISNFLKEKADHEVLSKEEEYVRRQSYMKRAREDVNTNIGGRLKRLTVSRSGTPSRHTGAKYVTPFSREVSKIENSSVDELFSDDMFSGDVPCVALDHEASDDDSSHFFYGTYRTGGSNNNEINIPDADDMNNNNNDNGENSKNTLVVNTERTLAVQHSMAGSEITSIHEEKETQEDANEEEKATVLSVKPNVNHPIPKSRTNSATVACAEDSHNTIPEPEASKSKVVNGKIIKKLPSLDNKLLNRGMSMITKRDKAKSVRRLSILTKNGKWSIT